MAIIVHKTSWRSIATRSQLAASNQHLQQMAQSACMYSGRNNVVPLSKSTTKTRRRLHSVILCYAICSRGAVLSFVPATVSTSNRGSSRSQLNAATAFPMEIPNFDVNTSPAAATASQPKVGVLLLNLGGPETGDDVEGMQCCSFQIGECFLVFIFSSVLTFTMTNFQSNCIRRIFVQSLCGS